MWRLGCLMYTLATSQQLFDTSELQQARDAAAQQQSTGAPQQQQLGGKQPQQRQQQAAGKQQQQQQWLAQRLGSCDDNELLLLAMSEVLGPWPRQVRRGGGGGRRRQAGAGPGAGRQQWGRSTHNAHALEMGGCHQQCCRRVCAAGTRVRCPCSWSPSPPCFMTTS
jgi:hypothetical protein